MAAFAVANCTPAATATYNPTSTGTMGATDFCNLFLQLCGAAHVGHTTLAECMTTYTASLNTAVNGAPANNGTIGACESYHLCNAYNISTTVHCPHAAGEALCVAATD